MKKSIFFKIFSGYFILILALIALILLFSFMTIKQHYQNTLVNDMKNLASVLEKQILPMVEEGRYKELDSFLKKTEKEVKTRITVVNPEGVVLADSEKDPEKMENYKYRPGILQALAGGVGKSIRFSLTVEQKMLYVGLPLEAGGKIQGVLRLSLYMRDIDHLLQELRSHIWWAVLIIATLSLFLALIFSLNLTRPLRKLIRASRQVAQGRFNTKVHLRNKDEFRELGESFNWMTDEIQKLFSNLSSQKEELQNIVSSIHEGLVVLDKEGRVQLSNKSFQKIAQTDVVEGKFHWEVLRNTRFQDLIERVQKEKRVIQEEIRQDDRIFLCTASFLSTTEGIVIIFHDLTEIKKGKKGINP